MQPSKPYLPIYAHTPQPFWADVLSPLVEILGGTVSKRRFLPDESAPFILARDVQSLSADYNAAYHNVVSNTKKQ